MFYIICMYVFEDNNINRIIIVDDEMNQREKEQKQ